MKSALIPAACITLVYFAISFRMKRSKLALAPGAYGTTIRTDFVGHLCDQTL